MEGSLGDNCLLGWEVEGRKGGTAVHLAFLKNIFVIYDSSRNVAKSNWILVTLLSEKCGSVSCSVVSDCNLIDCSLLGSSGHEILQARILEWEVISFSRGSSWARNQTQHLLHCRQILYHLSHQGSPNPSVCHFAFICQWWCWWIVSVSCLVVELLGLLQLLLTPGLLSGPR